MPSISPFGIISVGFPDPKIFLCIPASAADAAVVNHNGIKAVLANGLVAFLINGKATFTNGIRKFRNSPHCIILDN